MERSPIPLLVSVSAAGLVVLAISPLASVIVAGVAAVAGIVVRARGRPGLGLGLAATGVALCLAAVLVLALVDAGQRDPVILGPGTGLTPGRP